MKSFYLNSLLEKAIIEESDVDHHIQSMQPDEAKMELIKIVYGRHMPFCYTKGSKLGIKSWQDFEEIFHEFIKVKMCNAELQHLKKMVLSHQYTGTSFHNFIIDKVHRKKVHQIVEEKHAQHLHSHEHNPSDTILREEYIHKCEKTIRSTFQKGDHYVEVFRLLLAGHTTDEINHKLNINSAHIIKHRIHEVLKHIK